MKLEGYSKKRVHIILAVMICVQLASIIYYFQFRKEGYHSDEMWSYGYANSYYMKDIFQDGNGNLTYVGEWYDANIFRDYIVVNEGEQFTYDSVYQNQITDLSPPFHSMVLHTICSFFPEQYSRWFSFSINIVSFIVCMIFLYKSASLLKGEVFALCCCVVYGFSMGARDTFVFLRMYALCTAFTMVILYNVLCLWEKFKNGQRLLSANLMCVVVVSVLAFLTHYYMVSFMGLLTLFVCICTFFKRQYKFTFGFGFSMLFAFIISTIIFPAMFQVTESKVSATTVAAMDYNFKMRFQIICHYMMKRLFNISVSVYPSGRLPIIVGIFIFVLIVSIPMLFLLRNTTFSKKVRKYIKVVFFHPKRTCLYLRRRTNGIYIILLLVIISQIVVVGEISSVYGMGSMIDRYIFYMYPIVVMLALAFVYQVGIIVLRKKRNSHILLYIVCVLLVGVNIYNTNYYKDYLYPRRGGVAVENIIEGKNCIFMRNNPWMTTTMVPTLMCANEVAMVQYYELEKVKELYDIKKDEEVLVILDASITRSIEADVESMGVEMRVEGASYADKVNELYDEIIKELDDLDPTSEMKHLTTQYFYNRKMEVYLVNP